MRLGVPSAGAYLHSSAVIASWRDRSGGLVGAHRGALTLAEREDISRGIASGSSIRAIAAGLSRRFDGESGGRTSWWPAGYRASEADVRRGDWLCDLSSAYWPPMSSCEDRRQ